MSLALFRNWLSAAWGDLRRSPVQSFIAIGGLAIGLAAAIIAGIILVNQYSYDHFVPGHERLYYATLGNLPASGPGVHSIPGLNFPSGGDWNESTPPDLAGYLAGFTGIAAVTRFSQEEGVFGHEAVQTKETFYSADPNFFRLMPVPVLYGSLDGALARPDGMVISQATARKYFGRDDVVGQTLTLDHQHALTVMAVIEDLPLNATNLSHGIFVSSLAPFSDMSQQAGKPGFMRNGGMMSFVSTLALLKPGASLENLDQQGSVLVDSFVPRSLPFRRVLHFVAADRLHLDPKVAPGIRTRLGIYGAVALLILVLACVNFVNLSTARAVGRGMEVGIRKAVGAGRASLVLQFLGETILQVLLALCVAVALVEWLLPAVNTFLDSGAVLSYWRDPALIAALLAGAVTVGILAGFYPALVLSSIPPVAALKGWLRSSGSLVRQGLVTLQFAALAMLLIGAGLVFLQNRFATREALRADIDQMLFVRMPNKTAGPSRAGTAVASVCNQAFEAQVRTLPGVRGAICSGLSWLPEYMVGLPAKSGSGPMVPLKMITANVGLLELYGVKPLAGRFFDARHGDALPPNPSPTLMAHYVISLEAVRKLGFVSPQNAIGKPVTIITNNQAMGLPPDGKPPPALSGIVIGVVDDFMFQSPEDPSDPSAYSDGSTLTIPDSQPAMLNIKLKGEDIPETLDAIDAAWKKSGALDPIDRTFMDAYVQKKNMAVLREAQAFGVFSGVAALLACLGLFGVALSTAARRIKEIGVRKAMGARGWEIVALLLWQFAKPVLWANLVAWPLALWAMNRWLNGFAYHVAMPIWLFPAVGAATVLIALLTVAGQAWLVARQKPVLALRYE